MHDIDWLTWALSLLDVAFKSWYVWVGIVWAIFAMRVVREYRETPREESESE